MKLPNIDDTNPVSLEDIYKFANQHGFSAFTLDENMLAKAEKLALAVQINGRERQVALPKVQKMLLIFDVGRHTDK